MGYGFQKSALARSSETLALAESGGVQVQGKSTGNGCGQAAQPTTRPWLFCLRAWGAKPLEMPA